MNVIFCGRLFGTASGFDQVADEILYFYDFVWAKRGYDHFACDDLEIDYGLGLLKGYASENDGTPLWSEDIVDFMTHLELVK
jgi:hypothetical protein